ncbi:hypothetical protein FACS1894202_04720 [Clostridia bacterium]|nr:hypothetical protein FACS1894202_04720 [Clostridia bacterium]
MQYFKAISIDTKTTMICGRGNEKAYLLEGGEHALLIDTLLPSEGNLRDFVREITDKPVSVVNTHGHPDHTGCNLDFGRCFIHPADIWMLYDDFYTPFAPMITLPVTEGDYFELGDRRVDVAEVVGHTYGTIILLDNHTSAAFVGDAVNCNTLLNLPGSASVEKYKSSLERLAEFRAKFDRMYLGHSLEAQPPEHIDEAIELCAEIMAGTDDKFQGGFTDERSYYGKIRDKDFKRADGKTANIVYSRENIYNRRMRAPVRL